MLYSINKAAGTLTTVLLVKRMNDEQSFVIMLGAISDFDVGVGISESTTSPLSRSDFSDMQKTFRPQPLGRYVELQYHRVRVTADERVRENQKIYYINIEIEAFPMSPTTTEILEGAIDSLVPGQGRNAARKNVRDKVKRRFLPSRVGTTSSSVSSSTG